MIIGLAETHIVWEDKKENLRKLEGYTAAFSEYLKKIGGDGIIVFPEMSLTGFSMDTGKTKEAAGETVSACGELAKKYKAAIGVGWVSESGKSLCENRYSIVAPSGEEILDYTKIHPFAYSGEDKYFKGGDGIYSCYFGGFTVGTLICFDLRFPEIFQHLSDTADLIIVPANWPCQRSRAWRLLLEARAVENQCFIAGVNCCGMMNGQRYSGESGIFSPDGDLLCPVETVCGGDIASYGPDGIAVPHYEEYEKLYIYEIENTVENTRRGFPVKSARRPDVYRRLF